jgi:hypothetical protein
MKLYLAMAGLVFVAMAAWRIGGTLSADALGMAVGMFFGVVAGLPAALLVYACGRRREREQDDLGERRRAGYGAFAPGYPHPPVIVLAGHPGLAQQGYGDLFQQQARHALPAPRETVDVRQFKVVGEKEEWVDEW